MVWQKNWASKGSSDIDLALSKIVSAFNFNKPDLSLPALLAVRKKIALLKDANLKKDKLKSIDNIILSCAGFMGEVVTNQPEAIAGDHYNFRLNLISRASDVMIEKINWLNASETTNRKLSNDSLITIEHQIQIPTNASLTEPYWLEKPAKNAATFSVSNDTLIGLPEAESPLMVKLKLKIGAERFEVGLPLSYKKLDPVKGDVVEQLRIVPALELKFTQPIYFANDTANLYVGLNFKVNSSQKFANGEVKLSSNGQYLTGATHTYINVKNITINYPIKKDDLAKISSNGFKLDATYTVNGITYSSGQKLIQYPHLPTLQYFVPASTQILKGNLEVKAKKVGYIQGAGDFIPDFLKQAGIQVDVLSSADFSDVDNDMVFTKSNKLLDYDAIVMGIRANNTERRLGLWMPYLRTYVRDGGTLIMQYNTSQDAVLNDFSIYPFSISNKRVTEEDAEVKFLNPNHRLLNYPNKITADDFKGWVQERGTYFPDTWDKHFEPLFEMHDTGEEPLKGATIFAKYGKGNFIYTSLTFFRQLPAGNFGAAKLFFNFISASK